MARSSSNLDLSESPKRAELVETAWQLFYQDGYHAVGIDTVLAKAGVAKMTLYKHFQSKEALIGEVLRRRSREVQDGIERAIDAAGRSPAKRLLAIFEALDALFHTESFNGCAFIKAVAEYPDPKSEPHRVAAAHKAATRSRLLELARELPAKDPEALANSLVLLAEGAIVTAHVQARKSAAKEALEAARLLVAAAKRN